VFEKRTMAEFSAVGLPTRAKVARNSKVVRAARFYLPVFRMTFAERPEGTTSRRPADGMVSVGQPTDSPIPRFLRLLKLFSVQHRWVPVQNEMAFFKGNPLLPHAAATASLLLLTLLVLVPCAVLFSAVTPGSGPQAQRLLALPAICWAIWAIIALWAALDSSKLWRTLGRRVDPLGSYGVWGILLGVLNVGASLLAVVLHTSR